MWVQELCDRGPGQGRDGVPEHPEDVGQVQEDDVRVQGDGESGDDITDHGKDDDGCVPPLEHTILITGTTMIWKCEW